MTKYVNEDRCIKVEAHGATVLIDTVGSQIVSWITPNCGEQMYISAQCMSPPAASIRAGNPICYPQFATEGPLTKHGIIRMLPWTVVSNDNGKAELKIVMKDHEDSGYRFSFTAVFTAEITGPHGLKADLTVTNDANEPIQNQTVAFHPYWAVEDVTKIHFEGFEGSVGFDKTGLRENQLWIEEDERIPVPLGLPIDTKYTHKGDPIKYTILNRGYDDPRGNLKAELIRGFEDAVVWNIGEKECPELKDVPDDDWKHYVCMEQAQLTADELAPKATKSWTTHWTVSKA